VVVVINVSPWLLEAINERRDRKKYKAARRACLTPLFALFAWNKVCNSSSFSRIARELEIRGLAEGHGFNCGKLSFNTLQTSNETFKSKPPTVDAVRMCIPSL
jgi:hypothetical protein